MIGIISGSFTGFLISLLFSNPPVFPVTAALISIFVTSLIGIGFGSYPAYKAAQLDPIEALRYE